MSQLDFFDAGAGMPGSTACYPNRQRDRLRVEATLGLLEFGNAETAFYTPIGTLFAVGYRRVVYGDHGPYVEFERCQLRCWLRRKFDRNLPPDAYYEWLEPADGSGVKVYDQRRDVSQLPNPPAGGFRGNRPEGYADYRPGFIYVSPWELRFTESKKPA